MADLLHPTYLPFTADQLRGHFAPVHGPGDRDRHLRYYRASVEETRKHDELLRGGDKPTPAQTRLGRQMEKDERFWVAAALMSLYHADGGRGRAELFARLLKRAGLRPPPGFPRWQDALAGALELFFEVKSPLPWPLPRLAPPAPGRAHPDPVPQKAGEDAGDAAGGRDEGRRHAARPADRSSGHLRSQSALRYLGSRHLRPRPQPARAEHRRHARSQPVAGRPAEPPQARADLPGPADTRAHPARASRGRDSKSRLYGWLIPAYQDPGSSLLRQHLPHRDSAELAAAAARLGGASWEDCNAVAPGACSWLTATPDTQ